MITLFFNYLLVLTLSIIGSLIITKIISKEVISRKITIKLIKWLASFLLFICFSLIFFIITIITGYLFVEYLGLGIFAFLCSSLLMFLVYVISLYLLKKYVFKKKNNLNHIDQP